MRQGPILLLTVALVAAYAATVLPLEVMALLALAGASLAAVLSAMDADGRGGERQEEERPLQRLLSGEQNAR